ncbi:MAG: DNA polymerase III subunit beta [Planctomycetota bacterium]|nr:MAG: DNA polymerase III subunit beta [Planctomycetota bacterium]
MPNTQYSTHVLFLRNGNDKGGGFELWISDCFTDRLNPKSKIRNCISFRKLLQGGAWNRIKGWIVLNLSGGCPVFMEGRRHMKVIAQTAALQEALALVGSIVAARSPKPILRCVKLVAKDDTLVLMATDLEVGCRFGISAVKVEEPGEVLIPAGQFAGIVRESGGDESLTLETDKEACHVKGAGSHFKIFGFDPAEYPTVTEFPGEADFKIPAAVLGDMIGKTLFATAKSHSHYAISGVLWEAQDKSLKLVATDGHRLAQARGNLASATKQPRTAIVPAKLMGLIQRLDTAADALIDIRIEENQILVRSAQATLISSLVQGNFPKYSDVIPKDSDRKATIRTSQFEHRIRQAALLTNEESRGIRLNFGPESVTLSSRAPETGEAEVQCPIKLEGEPMEIGFNPVFLVDAMRIMDTDELLVEMNGGGKPAVIKAGADFLYVLMPVDLG